MEQWLSMISRAALEIQGQKIHNFNFLDEEFLVWRDVDCRWFIIELV